MKFLKWEITSIKKQDQFEAERFKEYVCSIHDFIKTMIETLETMDPNNTELVTEVFYQVQHLKAAAILYEENKFARPFTTINLIQTVEQVNDKMGMLQHMLVKYKAIREKIMPRIQEDLYESDEYDDEYINQATIGMKQGLEQLEQSLYRQARLVTRELISVDASIKYDYFRITSGVDIVRSHYDLCKRFPKGKAKYVIEIRHDRPCSKEG